METRTHPRTSASTTTTGSARRANIPAALGSRIVRIGSRSGTLATRPMPSARIIDAVCIAIPVRRGIVNIWCAPYR